MVVKLHNGDGAQLYSSWNGAVSVETAGDVVEINGLYGNKQGFKDGQEVILLSRKYHSTLLSLLMSSHLIINSKTFQESTLQ